MERETQFILEHIERPNLRILARTLSRRISTSFMETAVMPAGALRITVRRIDKSRIFGAPTRTRMRPF